MESQPQPQNPECRINPENFHPCKNFLNLLLSTVFGYAFTIFRGDFRLLTFFPLLLFLLYELPAQVSLSLIQSSETFLLSTTTYAFVEK